MVLEREVGNYYVEICKNGTVFLSYATKIDEDIWINVNDETFDNDDPLPIIDLKSRRLATSSEIEHLNQCIEANRYVEYKPLNQDEIWY